MAKKILWIYFTAILLGVLTGTVGSFFQLGIHVVSKYIAHFLIFCAEHGLPWWLMSSLTTMVCLLIAWLLVVRVAPEAGGSGVQEIEGTLLHKRPIFWHRLLPVKFIGGVLAIGAKMVLGREGPTIQIGGNLGAMLGDLLKFTLARKETLIAAGAAAGLATAFNAPLAGVLFVIEEMRHEFRFSFINFKTVAITCTMATIMLHTIIGSQAVIPMNIFSLPSLHSLILFFFFGIIVGFCGLVFNKSLMFALYSVDTFSKTQKLLYVIGVGLLVGYLAYRAPEMVGGGYEIIQTTLTMNPSTSLLTFWLIIRFFMTILSYSTGVPGGIFAPMLALGSLLGYAASYILHFIDIDASVHPGMFAVAGMGGLFAAAVRAPLTGIVLVVEMTQNYLLILPLMVTCLTSTTIVQLAKNPPIYAQLLRRTMSKH